MTVEQVMAEADSRGIDLLSITDHDSVEAQSPAVSLAERYAITYVTGVELNVTFPHAGRNLSLDFLGYGFEPQDRELTDKLKTMAAHRTERARQILKRLNRRFAEEGIDPLAETDMEKIERSVDGALGRPHIANYLIAKGIVKNRQQAFDKYLVECDVPKYPLSLPEASRLVRNAGGFLCLAHPNDPNGTSLAVFTLDLEEQAQIIREHMLNYIDGLECWHPRHSQKAIQYYVDFAQSQGLVVTGGTDCHQDPVIMGSIEVPGWVAEQFRRERRPA